MDEGAGAVEVCMHLGGEGLVDNVTLFTRSISALGKFIIIVVIQLQKIMGSWLYSTIHQFIKLLPERKILHAEQQGT